MKAIITNTIEQFDELQGRIHQALIDNLSNYSAECWAKPTLINTETGYYACPIEVTGVRGAMILAFGITNEERNSIVDLSQDDETWFPLPEEGGII